MEGRERDSEMATGVCTYILYVVMCRLIYSHDLMNINDAVATIEHVHSSALYTLHIALSHPFTRSHRIASNATHTQNCIHFVRASHFSII